MLCTISLRCEIYTTNQVTWLKNRKACTKYIFIIHINHIIKNSQTLTPDWTANNLNFNPLCAFQCDCWPRVGLCDVYFNVLLEDFPFFVRYIKKTPFRCFVPVKEKVDSTKKNSYISFYEI